MALFKVSSGSSANLPEKITPGWCYFTIDEQMFYIDYTDRSGLNRRAALNAETASSLWLGDSKAVIETALSDSNTKIPTSKAVMNYVASIDADITKLEGHWHSVSFTPTGKIDPEIHKHSINVNSTISNKLLSIEIQGTNEVTLNFKGAPTTIDTSLPKYN